MRFALSSGDELTLGNAGMRQPNWLERYPEPKTWTFQPNHRFVGLQVWQSQSAIHRVAVITLDTDCQQAASEAAAAEDEWVAPIKKDITIPEEAVIKDETDEKSSLKTEIVILIALVSFAAFLALVTLIGLLCRNARAKRNL